MVANDDIIKFCQRAIKFEETERDRRENQRYAASRELKAEAAINAYQSVIRYVQGERYNVNGDRYKEE